MFDNLVWIEVVNAMLIHDRQIAEHGGGSGVRDPGLLESALARPKNIALYDESADIFDLAAAYGHGIVSNHPFVDGNKRTGLVVCHTFLMVNGYRVQASAEETYLMYLGLAEGTRTQSELSTWLRSHAVRTVHP